MATFDQATVGADVTPNFEARKRSQPNVRTVQFGDGYEQRLTYGLNQNPQSWTLRWEYRTDTDADLIEAFFDARAADNDAFDWSPPDDASTYKWVCNEWDRTLTHPNLSTITATFRQVFEP